MITRDHFWWAGIGLAIVVSLAAEISSVWLGESLLGFSKTPVSAIMMAIVIGMFLANTITLPARLACGLHFCASTVLKIGIMLLGIRLSLLAAGRFTLVALPFVIAAIMAALTIVNVLGRKLGLSRQLTGLIAVGTSICGCTAIVATAPLIKANQSEVSYSIACITVFGLTAMFLYPFIAHSMFGDTPALAGLLLGTSIHETAQVVGAGLIYQNQYDSPLVLDIAMVTKLVRNLCMIAVIPIIGFLYAENRERERPTRFRELPGLIPWFIIGFAIMSALRTTGDVFGLSHAEGWNITVTAIQTVAEYCLLIAMAAVGLTSQLAGILRIGMRPFLLGLFAAALIGFLSFVLIFLFAVPLLELTVGFTHNA